MYIVFLQMHDFVSIVFLLFSADPFGENQEEKKVKRCKAGCGSEEGGFYTTKFFYSIWATSES